MKLDTINGAAAAVVMVGNGGAGTPVVAGKEMT